MIRVTVEMIPGGVGEPKLLGRTLIWNVGGDAKRGEYQVAVGRKGALETRQIFQKPTRRGRVRNYPRLSYNVWRLVARSLISAFPEERFIHDDQQ